MNAQEIISSGLLELYALEQCSATEAQQVENMLDNPEVAAAYEEIQESLFAFAERHSKAPSTGVKQKILAEIAQKDATPVIDLQQNKKDRTMFWLRAAMIALLLSGAANLLLLSGLQNAQTEIAQLRTTNSVLASEIEISRTNFNQEKNLNNLFAQGDVVKVKLNSTNKTEQEAVVYWDKNSGKTIISAKGLPKIDKDKSYQLWCLVDGKPVDMGVLDANHIGSNDLAQLKTTDLTPDAFAITIEPLGGRETPTLEQLMVIGNVKV